MKTLLTRNLFVSTVLSAAFAPMLFSSCQDEDFGYTAQEIAYKTNFEKIYGKIPADKSWDLSSWANWQAPVSASNTRTIGNGEATKGSLVLDRHYSIGESWYTVPQGLLSWLDNQLVEGNDNRYLGSSFVLKVPNNDFAIIPIYQGNSAIMSELELKINDYDITKIWTKSDNIQGDLGKGAGYQPCSYFDGYTSYTTVDQALVEVADNTSAGNYDVEKDGKKYVYKPSATKHPASTIMDVAVQAKPIIFHKNQIDVTSGQEYMYLSLRNIAKIPTPKGKRGHYETIDGNERWVDDQYLLDDDKKIITEMWDKNNNWTTIGDRLTSINSNGYMLALNVPWDKRPSATALANLLPGYNQSTSGAPQALIVGCEDANGSGSDHDVNDVVFLIVGYPNVPTVVPTTEVIKKRYMCEDLGATDDFDFNDIVVDVTQTMEYALEYQPTSADIDGFFNNEVDQNAIKQVEITNVAPQPGTKVQTAKISHVCGTLPIQAQVGNYLFPWITDPTDLALTRQELRAGGWKYEDGSWKSSKVNTPTRAAYDVKEEGWNPNEERIITGWDPQQNNITIYVQWPNDWKKPHTEKTNPTNDKTGLTGSNPYAGNGKQDFIDFIQGDRHVENVTFPEPGTVPYIIAMDPDVPWMKERKDILRSWLTNGEWDASDQYYKDNVAGPGSGAYYENDPDRAIIWTGKVGGEAYVTGVTCAKGSSEQLGAAEAIESGYNTINIYTQPFNDLNMHGYVGLSYIDSEGRWQILTVNDAEGYLDDANVLVGADKSTQWHCANIRLTQDQMNAIKNNGFVVQSRTNALVIREINFTKTEGFTVQLTDPALDAVNHNSVMGSITAADRRRDRSLSETGGRIPFAKASYSTGEKCTLTAVPSTGYAFTRWSDGNTTNPREVTTDLSPITAVFEFSEPTAEIDLNWDKFHRWSSYQADAHISSPTPFDGYSKDPTFGDVSVAGENYANLTGSDVLVVKCDAGVNLRLVFNRQSLDNNSADFFSFVTDSDKDYTVLHNDGDGKQTILINLAAIRAAKGYVHLNKMEKKGEGDITSMRLDKYDDSAETAFSTFKSNWDAAEDGMALTKEMFYEWTDVANDARVRGEGGRTDRVGNTNGVTNVVTAGQYCEAVLGSTYNIERQYANLSNATWLLVKTDAYSEAPRFWFNGKTLDFLGTDTRFCRIYKGNNGINHEYLVNLAAVRDASDGKSLLNAITTANGNTSAKVSVVKVTGYSCTNATAWDAAMTAVTDKTWYSATNINYSNNNDDTNFGNPNGYDSMVDLSGYHWMKITLQPKDNGGKDIRLYFNAKSESDRLVIDINKGENTKYLFVKDNIWYVDLDAIKTDQAGVVELHAIKGPEYGTSAQINGIQLDGQVVSNRTLTLSCADSDYDLYINGSQVTSAEVAAGTTVIVKAHYTGTTSLATDRYRFKWTGVTVNKSRSEDNEEVTFTMPDENSTVVVTPLYNIQPQVCLYNAESTKDGDNKYEAKFNLNDQPGSITTNGDGQTVTNTAPIYVPMGTEVTASATTKPGYAFVKWLWGVGTNPSSVTVTRKSDSKDIQYAPQAGYTEAGVDHRWTELSIPFNNSETQSYNIRKPGEGMNAIGIQFDNENVDIVHIFCDTWSALQSNIKVTNGYVVIRLTEETLSAINDGTQPFIQILGPEDVDLKSTKIIAMYEFAL